MQFAERLKTLRTERTKMTQDELAAALGVTPMTVWGWEKGRRRPSVDQVEGIANALGIRPAEFFMDADESAAVRAAMLILTAARAGSVNRQHEGLDDYSDADDPTGTGNSNRAYGRDYSQTIDPEVFTIPGPFLGRSLATSDRQETDTPTRQLVEVAV